ncbi:predicted protein [Nematostella vectensis]|uniref:Chitobiosyldiphosphodolichol beta-mannosyltransferase n=1 Tax=Nematostella vectensis TaxID=45351 RepID=A7SH20_NEMVE|nr:predicted protein [Nematostella vectensis]|eukprot:XP_001629033.1 predicted protein [Nematostella vectensis]
MAGYAVDLVGFGGSSPLKEILKHDKIKLIRIGDFPGFLTYLPRLLYYAVKAVFQSVQLFVILFSSAINCSHILVQNPPAIPSLAVAWLVSLLCNCKLLIDWHNFGYTILALGVGTPDHLLVRIAKWYEQCFGKMASGNFCVTEAMREDLQNNWCITASTLYDRPPERFKPTDVMSQHKLFMKLSSDYPVFGQTKSLPEFAEKVVEEVSAMTVKTNKGSIHQREDRPALIVSSTSWTEDEDFSVLLDALEGYERSVEKEKGLPNLLCAITGKGPQKDYYKQLISEKNLKHVSICTPWLDPEDYPKLLGIHCAMYLGYRPSLFLNPQGHEPERKD